MKKVYLLLTIILVLGLSACASSTKTEVIPTVSLHSGAQPAASASSSSGKATASAEVVPVAKVQLSFPVSGMVKTVEVTEGDAVVAGRRTRRRGDGGRRQALAHSLQARAAQRRGREEL